MAHQVPWNQVFLDEFIRLGALTDEEIEIMRTRLAGWTRTRQSMELHMSLRKIDTIIFRLKKKYDDVQPYSTILPPRRYSAKETYMDTN